MSGERGLISFFEKKEILKNLKKKEVMLTTNIEKLDFKNFLLSDNIDLDYVEVLIRQRFLFGKKEDKIYIIKDYDSKN